MAKKNSIKSSGNLLSEISQSIDYINRQTSQKPKIGIVLGSGLGSFTDGVDVHTTIPYSQIPFFPVSSIEGHKGALLFGRYKACELVIMQGRVHYYEGYTMQEITYPVRVMKYLGIHSLLLSNAAGGLNPKFKIGDLMIIDDHINLMPGPLAGKHEQAFGERFTDMSRPYDPSLIKIAGNASEKLNVPVHKGNYIGVMGPTYETPAEYNYLRLLGGDAVGMSTIPEVIVARQMKIHCFAISIITDLGIPGKIEKISHEMVQQEAQKAEPKLARIFKYLIEEISKL